MDISSYSSKKSETIYRYMYIDDNFQSFITDSSIFSVDVSRLVIAETPARTIRDTDILYTWKCGTMAVYLYYLMEAGHIICKAFLFRVSCV